MQEQAFRIQLAAGDLQNEEYAVRPGAIVAPVTIVTGAHDLAFFHDSAGYLARELPEVDLVELSWAGHLPSLERPTETTALIRAALGK